LDGEGSALSEHLADFPQLRMGKAHRTMLRGGICSDPCKTGEIMNVPDGPGSDGFGERDPDTFPREEMNVPDDRESPPGMASNGDLRKPRRTRWLLWVCLTVGVGLVVLVPGVIICGGIVGYFLLPNLDVAKEDADFIQMKSLTQACQTYKIDNDAWPPNLEVLTQPKPNGGSPYIEAYALVPKSVPGGRYQYDATGPQNHGEKPDIWVDVNGLKIGNWMQKVPR
jgi:hypothetical protein